MVRCAFRYSLVIIVYNSNIYAMHKINIFISYCKSIKSCCVKTNILTLNKNIIMKRIKRLLKNRQKFIKQCPSGGMCLNPICMFGCIDR